MKGARTQFNQRSLAFIVLISGVLGGLLIVFSILLLCKYCLNRKNSREAEQMKLLYETLNQSTLIDSNRLYHRGIRESSPLEPRRSNPLDRYQLAEEQWQIPSSKQIITNDFHSTGSQHSHTASFHDSREQSSNKQLDTHLDIDDEQAYLQVDPRCYVRQNSNASLISYRKADTPRLEKGLSLNVDPRPSPSSTSLSPYRQSSFDANLPHRSQQQQNVSTPSPSPSTQQEFYYTPRGSSLSIMANPLLSATPSTGSQHLSAPSASTSRKNSAAMIHEKKDLSATLVPSGQTSTVRSTIVQREHENSRSLEHSSPIVEQNLSSSTATTTTTTNAANDKQSRSFDAVHLLRPGSLRPESAANRRTKSYECADEHRPSRNSIAPPPIVIKIPDMSELVQAAQLSQLQNRRESVDREEYQRNSSRKTTLVQQINSEDQTISPADLWRLRQSYELEEQRKAEQRRDNGQLIERSSPEDLSLDLLTSTSIDSAGAMAIDLKTNANDDDPSKYQHRRKSSSNLLLPPPEVRRQALRRTFEKRRSCINQSNARREQQLLNNPNEFDDENQDNPNSKLDFSNLLKNLNSKSENSSFERSLETDFDMQSDTSSRGPNDQFTSIESSGNENTLPDVNHRFIPNRRQTEIQPQQQQQQQSPQISPHQDDSGYKSLESQNSQNRTFSLDWMSADGAESVIYLGDPRKQQRSVDVKDLDDQLEDQEKAAAAAAAADTNRRSPKLLQVGSHRSYQEGASMSLLSPTSLNTETRQHRSLSTNIPLVGQHSLSAKNVLLTSNTNPSIQNTKNNITCDFPPSSPTTFTRTASKKRREFSKEKRHPSSNVEVSPSPPPSSVTQQMRENSLKLITPSLLQVRHPDLRRTKSDVTRNLSLSTDSESNAYTQENQSNTAVSSETDNAPVSHSPASGTPTRQHLSPNSTRPESSHHILQRSPSSTTPPVTKSSQAEAFRSQRGSLSFDTQNPLIRPALATSPVNNKTRSNGPYALFPTCITKPRLKFSTVRDTTTGNSAHNAPVYSMPITRDYSIDERTNRIVNEFLMYDPSFDRNSKVQAEDLSPRTTPKRHHHYHSHGARTRAKTFEEATITTTNNNNSHPTPLQKQLSQQHQQTSRPVNNTKPRHHNSFQSNIRKHSQHQYPSIHLTDSIEQAEEEDSSDPTSPLLVINAQSNGINVRRENSMTAPSPSIIITGDDSGN